MEHAASQGKLDALKAAACGSVAGSRAAGVVKEGLRLCRQGKARSSIPKNACPFLLSCRLGLCPDRVGSETQPTWVAAGEPVSQVSRAASIARPGPKPSMTHGRDAC